MSTVSSLHNNGSNVSLGESVYSFDSGSLLLTKRVSNVTVTHTRPPQRYRLLVRDSTSGYCVPRTTLRPTESSTSPRRRRNDWSRAFYDHRDEGSGVKLITPRSGYQEFEALTDPSNFLLTPILDRGL